MNSPNAKMIGHYRNLHARAINRGDAKTAARTAQGIQRLEAADTNWFNRRAADIEHQEELLLDRTSIDIETEEPEAEP